MTFPFTSYGGPAVVLVNDHRLRDAVLRLLTTPFPAPAGKDPLAAFAEAMAGAFPARWPKSDGDASRAFRSSIENGARLGYIAVHASTVMAAQPAREALGALDLIRSSCGATMVRRESGQTLYCHYCGCLM